MTRITAELLRSLPLPRHEPGDTKEGRGQILVIGGCLAVPGAILLSAEGAMRAGAGKLQVATCRTIAAHLGLAVPEAMVLALAETGDGCIARHAGEALAEPAARADAILIGPGMMDAEETGALVGQVLTAAGEHTALVLDAGALVVLQDHKEALSRCGPRTVITPHAGEMAKLLGVPRDAVAADPRRHAREAASLLGCIVVMKGGTTHVVAPDDEAWVNESGSVGLATSGSGDVLAGVIAGLLARSTPAPLAAIWGVYLHAQAGARLTQRYGGIGLLARELPGEIPAIMAETAASEVGDTPREDPNLAEADTNL